MKIEHIIERNGRPALSHSSDILKGEFYFLSLNISVRSALPVQIIILHFKTFRSAPGTQSQSPCKLNAIVIPFNYSTASNSKLPCNLLIHMRIPTQLVPENWKTKHLDTKPVPKRTGSWAISLTGMRKLPHFQARKENLSYCRRNTPVIGFTA